MIADAALAEIERDVAAAIATGDQSRIRLLGHGEISIVLGWPAAAPEWAVKRLPPFFSAADFEEYAGVVERYVAHLRGAGVRVVDTEVRRYDRPDGRVVGFHVQPVFPAESIGTNLLRGLDPAAGHPLLDAIVEAVIRATDGTSGVDAQLANWVWIDGEAHQLDLTTPFVLDAAGQLPFDTRPFLSMLPAPLRPVVRNELLKLVRRWMTARGALVDLVANAYKEELDAWVPALLDAINRAVDPPITGTEARKILRADARLFPLLLRLERGQRWYQQRIRRRPYEFLLPERTTYERG